MRHSHLPALLALAATLLLAGCKSPCRQLSEKLCDCQETTVLKDACIQQVASEEGRIGPTAADQKVCQQLLPGCDCHTINTPEGKKACGLARQ